MSNCLALKSFIETKYSKNAAANLEKTRKYTNVLRGVSARTLIPKRISPTISEPTRGIDSGLNLVGGIGIYQIIAQMAKNTSKFKSSPLMIELWNFLYLKSTKDCAIICIKELYLQK